MSRPRIRRWSSWLSGAVLAVGAAAMVIAAVAAAGLPVREVELNDGGIWVTSDADGLFGRLNRPAGSLDAIFYPPGGARHAYTLDILQDGSAVAAWDKSGGKLFPVDVARGVTAGAYGLDVPPSTQVALAGGTIALLDPATGQLRAMRAPPGRSLASLGQLDPASEPVATIGLDAAGDGTQAPASARERPDPAASAAALAVSTGGTVFAVSAAGRVATVHPDGAGGFVGASYGELGRALTEPRATTVGERLVVLDGGRLVLPGGGTVDVGDSAVLQQPGPPASEVLVATDSELLGVDLDSGHVRTLGSEGRGTPAAPVRLDVCIHAAWAGASGGYYRSCDGGTIAKANLDDTQRLVAPVFRVNRGAIVLNDLTTGAVWDLADQRRVDDWSSVRPPPAPDDSENSQTQTDPQVLLARPPKAVDDVLGARPGRTTLLYVLDNDSDPAGSILSIVEVSPPSVDSATLAISPDGQTVAITVAEPSAPIQFTYTIDDGVQTAQASVTVQVRRPEENRSPEPRVGYEPPALTVPSGGQLSVPVLADWRDFDGDPIALVGASATGGAVSARPDGRLDYTAPVPGSVQTLTYRVGDGLGEPTTGSIDVTVQPPTATAGVAPITQPDVARGQVGDPITLRPLDNDLPGSDPTNRDAVLALAGEVASPANATVVTNLHTGVVVFTAARPGAYLMEYTAAFGNAPFAKGSIRVDVVPVPDSPNPPVAMPDQALLHGQVPTTVDVLANDFDPAGGVLVVQRAAPVEADSGLQVAIVDGKWVRIGALAAFTNSQPTIVRYTITNGVTGPVTGEITVSRLPDSASTVPVPVDDVAVVRAGDTVTVAVLDNDSNPAGAAMSLVSNVVGAPGPGRLVIKSPGTEDAGAAYVTGDLVRYVAPATVEEAMTVVVEYVVRNAAGDTAVGQLRVTVHPAPGEQQPNRPPAPVPLEARVVSGQAVTIDIPTSGVDGDGDSVTLVGLDTAPALGRVVSQNATSLTYLAYPTSTGTDTFDYRVRDRYGATGTATIRVGVIPPGPPQPPVAVDDHVTAAPGARLHVDVLANDLIAAGDVVRIEPLAARNPDLGADVTLAGPQGPIDMAAPDLSGKPRLVAYAISNGIGDASMATVTVRAQEGFNNPPVVYDAHPSAGPQDLTVTVDVLERSFDPDGERAELRVTTVFDSRAEVTGTVVTLPVTDSPYTVAYELADAGGATAIGLIHVPAPGSGAPYVRPGARIEVDRDGTKSLDINDYVISPRDRPVRLTTANRIWASPPDGLSAADNGQDTIVLTGLNGYAGPGALTFEVTDGDSLTDPEARTAVVTIPVQVGEVTPVLHCPDEPLSVVEGGDELRIDVTSVCYVWVDSDRSRSDLRYSAAWDGPADGFNLDGSGSQTLQVSADSGTAPGTVGVLTIGIEGTDAVADRLRIRVDPAPPLAIAAMFVDGVKAGDTTTVDVARFARSRLRDPAFSVVQVSQSSGMRATASTSGTTVSITPDAAAHGEMRFDVTVTDVADRSRVDRHVVGQIRLNVLGVPDAPGRPQLGAEVLSRSVELSWTVPANNGAPIEQYEVAWSGGSQLCAASPCLITGLTNGRTYTFTVRARNLVGWSPPSPSSSPAVPDTVPGAVTGIITSQPQDGSLLLTWQAPTNEGTAIQYYDVLWSGGGSARASGTQLRVTGLDNNTVYTFTIVAVNARGPGPSAQVQGQSAGAPPRPAAPSFTSVNLAGSTTRAVTVSWPAVDPNGWNPVTYTLTRTGNGTVTVCADVTATSCDDDGIANDGTVYTYTVVAENAAAAQGPGHTSPASPGAQMEATATPEPLTNVSIQPTGTNGQATISFDVGASHGASNTVSCTVSGDSCGTWSFPVGGQSGVTRTINGLPNGTAVTAYLRACNGSGGGAGAGSPCNSAVGASVTTYGPLGNPSISTSTSGQTVYFTVSVNPNGKPATVRVTTNYGTNQTFTTGVGSWSWSSSNTPGYSSTVTINVTVSDPDGVRGSTTGQASRTTGPAPPPSISLSVYPGAGGAVYYAVTLDNFPPNDFVVLSCRDENNGHWGSDTIATDANGHGSDTRLCGPLFEQNEYHWVASGGVQSNRFYF